MVTVVINGITISSRGTVEVKNGKIYIDQRDVTPDGKDIRIEVQGNVENLTVDACNRVSVKGNVGELSTVSGDVECGNVSGSVRTTSGDVSCKSVGGSVETVSGDVEATDVKGGIRTVSGDVRRG